MVIRWDVVPTSSSQPDSQEPSFRHLPQGPWFATIPTAWASLQEFSTDCPYISGCCYVMVCFGFFIYSDPSYLIASPWEQELCLHGALHTVGSRSSLPMATGDKDGDQDRGGNSTFQFWLSVLSLRPNNLFETASPSHPCSGNHFARNC